MGFEELPTDLKNVVSAFAYDCKWEIALKCLQTCETVREMDVSAVFTRDVMWSQKYKEFRPNPLTAFEPIQNFTGTWEDYVDWHAVEELLWRLDFRRKFVKFANSRLEWRTSFRQNWKSIEQFDGFYRFLLYTRVPCFKPIWEPCGFNCLTSYRSPYVSARWFLGR